MALKRLFTRGVLTLTFILSSAAATLAADPGIPFPAPFGTSQISDQIRGFMLIYNFYASSPASPATTNTRFTITNTHDQLGIAVHLFFIDGVTCSISDRYICLSQNQTSTFLASEQDPGTQGYLVAVATREDGSPIPFDFLIGDAYVKLQTGHFGNLAAEAIPSWNVAYPLLSNDGTLFLLGIGGLPRVLAVDNIGSRLDGNDTLLVVNGVGGNYTIAPFAIGSLFGILYDDAEQPHSWNRTGSCQLVLPLNNDFPRTSPRFDVVIPAGQTGWMKFWSTSTTNNTPYGTSADGRALLGAVFQRNSQSGTASGAFQGARNLHKLNLVSVYNFELQNGQTATSGFNRAFTAAAAQQQTIQLTTFVIPVFPANCGFVFETAG